MSKTLEGMARACWYYSAGDRPSARDMRSMRAVLHWLADHVPDEMVAEFENAAVTLRGGYGSEVVYLAISAALRAAAGGGEK